MDHEEIIEAAKVKLMEDFDAVLIVARYSQDGEHSQVMCVWNAHITEAMGMARAAAMRTESQYIEGDGGEDDDE